jgi:glycosyltransferase involved in cell wall biosynthesis
VLVFLDGDMRNDPHDIPHLLQKIDEGYDVVSGWRRDRRDDARRVIPSKIANWVIARLTGVALSDFGCTLKAYRREVIHDVKLYGEMHRFIPVFAAMIGARITELPVNHRPRTYGKSKYSLTRRSRVMLDLITVKVLGGYSTRPVYVLGFAAFAMWAVALILAAIVILQKVMPPYVPAHNNPLLLLCAVLVIVGVQLILIALSIRMFHESQSRPTYVVREILEKTPHRQPATNGRPAVRNR